jgi:hypothetical protein
LVDAHVWEVREAFSAQALGVFRELPSQLGGFTHPDNKLTPRVGPWPSGIPSAPPEPRYVLTLANCANATSASARSGYASARAKAWPSCWKTGELPVAIETTRGLVVDRLLAAGHPVIPVHPNAFHAVRPRWRAARAKNDPGDSFKLAD